MVTETMTMAERSLGGDSLATMPSPLSTRVERNTATQAKASLFSMCRVLGSIRQITAKIARMKEIQIYLRFNRRTNCYGTVFLPTAPNSFVVLPVFELRT